MEIILTWRIRTWSGTIIARTSTAVVRAGRATVTSSIADPSLQRERRKKKKNSMCDEICNYLSKSQAWITLLRLLSTPGSIPSSIVQMRRFSHVYSRCRCVSTLCDREIYPYSSSINFHAGTLVFSHFGVLRWFKIYKTKSSRSSSLYNKYDLYAVYYINL